MFMKITILAINILLLIINILSTMHFSLHDFQSKGMGLLVKLATRTSTRRMWGRWSSRLPWCLRYKWYLETWGNPKIFQEKHTQNQTTKLKCWKYMVYMLLWMKWFGGLLDGWIRWWVGFNTFRLMLTMFISCRFDPLEATSYVWLPKVMIEPLPLSRTE